MLKMIENWKGKVEIDGTEYDSVKDAMNAFKTISGDIHIILKARHENVSKAKIEASDGATEYRVTVKQYMTKEATPDFDFMQKWNNNVPMPLRTMVGTVEKETRGMIYMNLHGVAQETITCMCCGKELTNPISRHYGIGPVCMGKIGIHCDIDNIDEIKEKLVDVTWSGWIIKSAITEREEV